MLNLKLGKVPYSTYRNLFLYGLFGACAAIIEYFIFAVLVQAIKLPEISNIIGSICGFLFTFTTNTFLNFKKRDKLVKRFFIYGSICAMGIILTTVIITLFKNIINLYILKAICIVCVSLLQFILNKIITYK